MPNAITDQLQGMYGRSPTTPWTPPTEPQAQNQPAQPPAQGFRQKLGRFLSDPRVMTAMLAAGRRVATPYPGESQFGRFQNAAMEGYSSLGLMQQLQQEKDRWWEKQNLERQKVEEEVRLREEGHEIERTRGRETSTHNQALEELGQNRIDMEKAYRGADREQSKALAEMLDIRENRRIKAQEDQVRVAERSVSVAEGKGAREAELQPLQLQLARDKIILATTQTQAAIAGMMATVQAEDPRAKQAMNDYKVALSQVRVILGMTYESKKDTEIQVMVDTIMQQLAKVRAAAGGSSAAPGFSASASAGTPSTGAGPGAPGEERMIGGHPYRYNAQATQWELVGK